MSYVVVLAIMLILWCSGYEDGVDCLFLRYRNIISHEIHFHEGRKLALELIHQIIVVKIRFCFQFIVHDYLILYLLINK